MSTRKILTLLIAACAALALAACGGDDETPTAAYEADANAVLDPLAADLEEGGKAAANPASPEAFIATIEDIQKTLSDAADDLGAITPPEEVASAQDQVIAALGDYNSALDPVKQAAKGGDAQALTQAGQELPKATEAFAAEVGAAQAEFQAAGIELNLN